MPQPFRFSRLATCLLGLVLVTASAREADASLAFRNLIRADFEFEVVDGPLSSLTGIPAGAVIPFTALGYMEFTLADAPSNATTIPFVDATGELPGVSPSAFQPFAIRPIEFVGGELTNIVRNGSGDIVSADVSNLVMFWEMTGTPAILGGQEVRLYGTTPLDFNGSVRGTPFANGDVIAGPSDFNVLLDLGLGDQDPLVSIGRNRTLTAVPEPGSLWVWGLMAVGLFAARRRFRTRGDN